MPQDLRQRAMTSRNRLVAVVAEHAFGMRRHVAFGDHALAPTGEQYDASRRGALLDCRGRPSSARVKLVRGIAEPVPDTPAPRPRTLPTRSHASSELQERPDIDIVAGVLATCMILRLYPADLRKEHQVRRQVLVDAHRENVILENTVRTQQA